MTSFMQRRERQFSDFLEYMSSIWGLLSFGMILVPLLLMLMFDTVDAALQPIASARVGGPIALVCTFVIAFYMFTLRDELYRYSRTRSFSAQPRRPIPTWALVFFVSAILLAFFLAFGITTKDSLVSVPGTKVEGMLAYGKAGHMFFKLVMTGCLVFTFVFLALSAGMMAAYKYGKSMDTSGPDAPIYTDEGRLKTQVLAAASAELGLGVNPTVSAMKRSGDGGIVLTLHHKGDVVEVDQVQFREDRTWIVRANYAGELVDVEEKEVRLIQIEKTAS